MAHGDTNHPGFSKLFDIISTSWFIRRLGKQLREYLLHCPQCQVYQTKRHRPYGALQPIESPSVPFHTISIDFVLALPLSAEGFDCVLSVTDKFSKRITLIPGKITFTATDWAKLLLDRLYLADWGVPKVILSDRDPKFLSDLWKAIFNELGVALLYSTAYHPQTDGQSERTNQTVEIALRYYLAALERPELWPSVLATIQSNLNNSISATGKTPNEAVYGFTPDLPLDLLTSSRSPSAATLSPCQARVEVRDALNMAAMAMKQRYDKRHQQIYFAVGDFVQLRLHKGYDIPSNSRKLGQQYADPFRVLEKIGRLAYRLELPDHWRFHPVFSVAHLEPVPDPDKDPFKRPRPDQPPPVFVEGDTDTNKSWELEKVVDKRVTSTGLIKYLVKWKDYSTHENRWISAKDMGNAQELVEEYEKAYRLLPTASRLTLSSLTPTKRRRPRKTQTAPSVPSQPAAAAERAEPIAASGGALALRRSKRLGKEIGS